MPEETTVVQFSATDIMKNIPHRYPFFLVDRVTECVVGKYAKGYKNLTMNEEFFQGHFPDFPVMPGVLQIEAMAQLAGCIFMTVEELKGKIMFFSGIDKARFKTPVKPGDRFDMEAEVVKVKFPLVKVHTRAFVDGKLAVEADLLLSIIDKKEN